MLPFLLVGAGSFVGGNARYFFARWVGGAIDARFPLGTFLINVSGSFVLGLIGGLLAERALPWLRAQGRPGSLLVQGQSLGGAVAAEMARRGFGTQLVLISPLTSVADMARHYVPWVPIRLFLRDRLALLVAEPDEDVLLLQPRLQEAGRQRVQAAIDHINHYGSAHSDSIVTGDEGVAQKFLMAVEQAY